MRNAAGTRLPSRSDANGSGWEPPRVRARGCPARVPPPQGRGQGVYLAGLPGPDHRRHHNLSAPLIWVWDNLNIHLASELADFAKENEAWLRVYRLPLYAPDLNSAEGIWSLLKRSIANFAAADLDGLVRIVKTPAEEDPVPAPPDRRLRGRDRADNRALVITRTQRVQPGYR